MVRPCKISCVIEEELQKKIDNEVKQKKKINIDFNKSNVVREALRFYFNSKGE